MTPDALARSRLDHLVVVADNLTQGVAWCEATLGITPGLGGEHPLMGTHNRLFRIATVNHPLAYFEIIAINPAQPEPIPPRAARWFDMDSTALREAVRQQGPRLIHFVAQVPDLRSSLVRLSALGIERGHPLKAQRDTPRGLLQWEISVRDDGRRLYQGTLPTLIQWGERHPAASMPASGVTLDSLSVTHPEAKQLQTAYTALGLSVVALQQGQANLVAHLNTPKGRVMLASEGL